MKLQFRSHYWKSVPTGPIENVRFRLKLYEECERNPELQQGIREICAVDPIFWLNAFGWQYNPRNIDNEVGPFICWPEQREVLLDTMDRLWIDGKDALWEKSRELGATWLALFGQSWFSLFHKYKKFLCFTHTSEAMDRSDDPDSLFWKVEFIIDHLPEWMSMKANKMKGVMKFPGTKSSMTGVASTKRTGVGGRATSILSDETGRQENAATMIGQTRDTGPRLFISTHYGINAFYSLCKRPDMWKRYLHWSMHPDKNPGLYRSKPGGYEILDTNYKFPADYPFITTGKPFGGPFKGLRSVWYDQECIERASERDVAMHLDIDAEGSSDQFFDAGVIYKLIEEKGFAPDWEGDVFPNYVDGTVINFTERRGGPLRIWGFRPDRIAPVGKYACGTDTGRGKGVTPSCASFGNASTREKVAEYVTGRLRPDEYGVSVTALCRFFRDARVAWEVPGPGVEMGAKIIELGYSNIYYQKDEMPHTMSPTTSDRPGWRNTSASLYNLLEAYRSALQGRLLVNRSKEAMKVCLEYRPTASGGVEHPGERPSDSFDGAGKSHGDIVVADALMWKMMCDLVDVTSFRARPDGVHEVPRLKPGSWNWRRELQRQADERYESDEEMEGWESSFMVSR